MQNRVIIRVWDHTYSSWADPRINPFAAFFTRGRIGHVSLIFNYELNLSEKSELTNS